MIYTWKPGDKAIHSIKHFSRQGQKYVAKYRDHPCIIVKLGERNIEVIFENGFKKLVKPISLRKENENT